MSNLLTHIERWLRRHEQHFADLPTVTVPSAEIDDYQVQYQNDLHYMADLVDEFAHRATQTAANVAGPLVESILARPVLDDQDIPAGPFATVGVQDALLDWRIYTDWAFAEALHAVRNGGPKWVTA